ncbi:HAD-IA family hydrolase [Streptomyces sp. NPDC051940]|uniref:HAD family hydrolase n=1 Tax=Streptomyces sp. NPDC051940 TaxID=3155675 RepID=UPI003411F84F
MKAVVFDMDGTLVDTMPLVLSTYAATLRGLGGPEVTREQIQGAFRLGTAPAVLAHFLGRAITPEELERHRAEFRSRATAVEPFPGVVAMLDTLRAGGLPLAVYTGASRVGARRSLGMTGLDAYFPVVVTGDDVPRQKPAADGLHQACAALGVPAERTAYVGDTVADLDCATAAGARPVHAAWDAEVPHVPGHARAGHPREVPGLVASGGSGRP